LGAARREGRGSNQSERLAHALAACWTLPVRDLLARTRDTATQTTLTPDARLANVAGAFAVRNGECGMRNGEGQRHSEFRIPNSSLVLVDDVFTTGATLAECARTLEAAGYDQVSAVTFGRAAIPDFS
ncbi:MAG: ComF family protein, partial [Gemmatimonadales bacterium]